MHWLLAQLRGCGTGRRDRIAAFVALSVFSQRCHASSKASTFALHDGVGLNNRNTGKSRRSSRGGANSQRPKFARKGSGEGQQLGESKKEEKGASATTIQGGNSSSSSSSRGFSLGNGMKVQLPVLSPLVGENNIGLKDVLHVRNEERAFNKDALVSAIEGMHQTLVERSPPFFVGTHDVGPSGGGMTSNAKLAKALQRWPEVFHRLRATALPLFLQAPDTTSPSVASVAEACQALSEALIVVDDVSRATGMRAERMFPATLVVALWNCLPRFYVQAQHSSRAPHAHGSLVPALVEGLPSFWREFKNARRALALRTRDLNDLLLPSELVRVLLCMEQCGALSDDIIGPIGTQLLRRYKTSAAPLNGPQHVATNHLLSAHFVASVVDKEESPFQGDTALAFARLLGRAHIVNHFQLHRLMHTILLPQVMVALQASAPDEIILFELTRCYTRYAVSGSAVSQLTALWMPHLFCMTLDKCSELLGILGDGGVGRVAVVAEEDYFPLVEAVLKRASLLFHHEHQSSSSTGVPPTADLVPAAIADASAAVSADSVVKFICALVTVNSVHWGEMYVLAATALERSLDGLLFSDVVRVTRALLRRNSHIPYHSLHSRLSHRLLIDGTALKDVKIGGLSLLAAALMSSPSPTIPKTFISSNKYLPCDMQTAILRNPSGGDLIGLDGARALAVFRRHGKKLGLRSFAAAICVAPLAQLPRRSQEAVIMHFTSISSALEVPWLVRGMVSLTSQIPEAVDPVSVQRWFSRFTAVDVARQLDMEHAAMLLSILSDDEYSRDCALAKQKIVKQASTLLLQESVSLDALIPLVVALQRANVFFPQLYSRICRILLANVRQTPWRLLLPVFHVVADEFTRRPHGNGSVFRDVWEQLRTRLMEEAASSLEAEDVVLALNGLAALDVKDRPVFSVLLHRLWTIYLSVCTPVGAEHRNATAETSPKPVVWVDSLLSGCTPSALAVLITTLIYSGRGKAIDAFMPWLLLRTRPVVKDLYPIDLLHLMPALLSCFTAASTIDGDASCDRTAWLCSPLNHTILHTTYDECRELFLHMYEDEATAKDPTALGTQRAEWTPKARVSVLRVPRYLFAELLVALCQCELRDEAVATASASRMTRRLCMQLPVADLVDLTMALCFHFPPPPPPPLQEVTVNDEGGVTRDEKGERYETKEEGTNCISCGERTEGNDAAAAAATSSTPAPHQRFLPPVLTALWDRAEELQSSHVDALLRCLRHYYGGKVDADFLDRLLKHKEATLAGVHASHRRPQDTAAAEQGPANLGEPTAEDLFMS
ncbi:hypothetical protein MOQ_002126 [Trypanosoma cruzi marinkellei]|uniref:Uncharacterized protein n=1 Tax=Trypanosoma cruzi marinkellei TaxID=85056 RepID=K2MQX7_TRYCR|nr:hypothetical protein MOQ_002126 [Trypanosoma cruzi marinkellei]